MAGKNEVTLTFAGDSRSLERTLDSVGQSSRQAEQDLDRVGQGASRLDRVVGEGGRRFGDYGRGLGGVGDRADEVDTRMMGLSDGIQGVTDLMGGNGKLKPHEMAMAFSDLGSAAYNTVIPSLQDVTGKTKNLVVGFKEGTGVGGAFKNNLGTIGIAAAGAAAVIGLLTFAIIDHNRRQQEAKQRASEFSDQITEMGGDVAAASDSLLASDERFQELRSSLAAAGVTTSQYMDMLRSGRVDIEAWGEAHGLNHDQVLDLILGTAMLQEQINDGTRVWEDNAAATQESTAALENYGDALRAQFDPLFGMMDAQRDQADAIREEREARDALTAAIRDHGAGSMEAAEAQRQLEDAQIAVRDSVIDLEGAATDLRVAVENGTVSAESARRQFIEMAVSQGVSRRAAEQMASQFNATTKEAQRLGGQKPTVRVSQTGGDKVLDKLRRVEEQANKIPKRINVDVFASLTGSGAGLMGGKRQHGGQVASGRLYEVAEHGKAELLEMGGRSYLIPGADGRVIPADDTAGMGSFMREPQGSRATNVTINLTVQGSIRSDRDLIELIRDELSYGGFGGALR